MNLAVRKVGPAISILVLGSKIHCRKQYTAAIKLLPQPRPHTHILKLRLKKAFNVISWYSASLIPESSSVVKPKLERINLANVILACLSGSSPFKSRNSSFKFGIDFLYLSGQYHILI